MAEVASISHKESNLQSFSSYERHGAHGGKLPGRREHDRHVHKLNHFLSEVRAKPRLCWKTINLLKQGSLKDTHLKQVFFHQKKGKPPFTRQCSGV